MPTLKELPTTAQPPSELVTHDNVTSKRFAPRVVSAADDTQAQQVPQIQIAASDHVITTDECGFDDVFQWSAAAVIKFTTPTCTREQGSHYVDHVLNL